MNTRVNLWLLSAIAVAVLGGAHSAVAAVDYTFERVAGGGDTLGGYELAGLGAPAINDLGRVAFLATYTGGDGIFTNTGRVAGTGDVLSGITLTGVSGVPAINSSNKVAFIGNYVGGSGIFTQDGAVAVTGQTIGGKTLIGFESLDMNDAGEIVFLAQYGTGAQGIFTPSRLVATNGTQIGSLKVGIFINKPSINESGNIAFSSTYQSGGGAQAVFTEHAVIAKPGSVIDGKTIGSPGGASINDGGLVAFGAGFAGGQGLFTQADGLAYTGDMIEGLKITGFSSPALMNNAGEVAFLATYDASSFSVGLFTSSDAVLRMGDSLDGRIVTGYSGYTPINATGDIAVSLSFTNAPSAIYVAKPVPEPSVLAFLATGVLVIGVAGGLRRRGYRKDSTASLVE